MQCVFSLTSRGRAEGLPDHGPQPAAGRPDHRPRADAAGPSHATHSSTQLPPAEGLPPPPSPRLGPEATSGPRAFLPGAQADRTGSDSRRRAERSRGGGGPEEEKEAPSPSPPRLTDRPPAARDDSPLRSERGLRLPAEMEGSRPLRKVPVRIVHAECSSRPEGRAYLPQSGEARGASEPRSPAEQPAPSLFTAYARQDPAPAGARRSEEDAKREELARDIMGRDKSLVDILDQRRRVTTMDLMEGLFPTEEQVLEGNQQRRRASCGSRLPPSSPRSTDRREEEEPPAQAALVPSSSYYNTSAPKAELLMKMKDMQEQQEEEEEELDVDLARKKQELISSLAQKLEVLREARCLLQEDVEANEALGREVEAAVRRLCRPNQLDKFRMFVGDLDKVVSLLLSLAGRLARVENALDGLEEEAPPEEKRTLAEKRKLLMLQHEDAKELKDNLDRRERLVSGAMAAHLDPGGLDDYRHFVKMKAALIIEQRKLEDKVKLGEEQLKCLTDSLTDSLTAA
ncbi:Protein Shroom2 [Liparis tanakae]|uniref:Protein Shroom2 n=1 Tax=Liparis tanakae TaxID=230148 RepID=A0A4Z2J2L2_9TELE|nr:Protein Shroom2 [Liparis tanakae]